MIYILHAFWQYSHNIWIFTFSQQKVIVYFILSDKLKHTERGSNPNISLNPYLLFRGFLIPPKTIPLYYSLFWDTNKTPELNSSSNNYNLFFYNTEFTLKLLALDMFVFKKLILVYCEEIP